MVFFQSFINDANRSRQHFKQAKPVEQAPLAGSLSELPTDVGTGVGIVARPHSVAQVPSVQQNFPDVGFAVPDGLKHAGQATSNHPAGFVVQKTAAAQSWQPEIECRPTIDVAVVEASSRFAPQRKVSKSAAPTREPCTVAVSPDAFAEEEAPGPLAKRTNKPVLEDVDKSAPQARHRQRAEVLLPEAHEKRIQTPLPLTQEAVTQDSEARFATAWVQQAKQALGLLSPLAEKPGSGPQVHIGTIEVIVEAAPVVQQKSSPNAGFMRDSGRSYQRRL